MRRGIEDCFVGCIADSYCVPAMTAMEVPTFLWERTSELIRHIGAILYTLPWPLEAM